MRVVFLADSFLLDKATRVNGTQVQMYNLARAFVDRGLEVHYIALTQIGKNTEELIDNIRVHWIKNDTGLLRWLKDFVSIKQVLRCINPDVIYQRGRSHLTYIGARWARLNKRVFIWGSNGEDSCDFWKEIKRLMRSPRPIWKKIILYPDCWLRDMLIHKGIRQAHFVINQTEHQKQQLLKNYGKQGIVLPSYFRLTHPVFKEKKEKQCLWVANLSRQKHPEKFLQLAQQCGSLKDWKFILVGGTPDKEYSKALMEKSSSLSNVVMAGPVPFSKIDTFFSQASLFVNTSSLEADGISNAMIQSWLHGVPVLSLNHDPNGWIKQCNLGFCAKGSLDAFISNGFHMMKDLNALEEMGKRCLDFAANTFASPKTIETYIEIITSVYSCLTHNAQKKA